MIQLREPEPMWLRVAAIASVLLVLLGFARVAGATACTDGVDCLCDTITGTYPDVKFCEDFETPGYATDATIGSGGGQNTAWYSRYGVGGGPNCLGPSCWGDVGGTSIAPASDVGETVHDGAQMLALLHANSSTGGTLGHYKFSSTRYKTFGITMAMRFSSNYDTSQLGTGIKTDFWGCDPTNCPDGGGFTSTHELPLGAKETIYNANDPTLRVCKGDAPTGSDTCLGGFPFRSIIHIDQQNTGNCAGITGGDLYPPCWGASMTASPTLDAPTATVGSVCNQGGHIGFCPSESLYEWEVTPGIGLGDWMCVQIHFTNFGELNTRHRMWVNGTLMNDTSNLDTLTYAIGGQEGGWNAFAPDGYINGPGSGGYGGATTAARYEDNIVFTSASDPVPCSAIGFASSGVCGDGVVNTGEACDDGGTAGTPGTADGCAADCSAIDAGWECLTPGAACNVLPAITLSPGTLSPSANRGSSPASGSFTVDNTGGGTLEYTITDNQTWISQSPTSGTSTGEADTITVTYATTALAAGTHNATITVTDATSSNSPQTVAVTLTINAVCGDGFREGGEGCDDSNTTAGDGCSATCTAEVIAPAAPSSSDGSRGGSPGLLTPRAF